MKTYFLIAMFFLTSCLTAVSQETTISNKAERPICFTIQEMETFKCELVTKLLTMPSWNKQTNLENKISFEDADIQIYGYKEFPILQIDFRFTTPSIRKKGFLYQAQYIYTSQPTLNKTIVIIDNGTTIYFKPN